MVSALPLPAAAPPPDILIVDTETVTSRYAELFDGNPMRIVTTAHTPVALEYVRRVAPALVVTELALQDGNGVEICSTAKALRTPSSVLVTTGDPAAVPAALAAGCDGVLLKPFAPNLLISRISRLLRERSTRLRLEVARRLSKAAHLTERSDLLRTGTNRKWPNTHCPYCASSGVTSFDFTSMRRAWYACLECRKVWIARRQE
jgi:DNA-binding NarL/FixJ family response regulator